MMKSQLLLPLLLASIVFTAEGCRRRTDLEVAAGVKSPAQLEDDITSLRREREVLLAKLQTEQLEAAQRVSDLTLERDDLMSSKSSAEAEIKRAREELLSKQNATEAEKMEIQSRLEGAQKNLDGIQQKLRGNQSLLNEQLAKIKSLNEEMRKLSDRITELNAKIEELTQALNAERLKNEQLVQSQGPLISSSIPSSASGERVPSEATSSSGGSGSTTSNPSQGGAKAKSRQFFFDQGGSKLCLEFGSTSANASLLALACLDPGTATSLRQHFLLEQVSGQGFLLIDQRSGSCARIDARVTTRVALQPCQRGGLADELWDFINVDTDTGRFRLINKKSGMCLGVSPEKRVIQQSCSTAPELQSS